MKEMQLSNSHEMIIDEVEEDFSDDYKDIEELIDSHSRKYYNESESFEERRLDNLFYDHLYRLKNSLKFIEEHESPTPLDLFLIIFIRKTIIAFLQDDIDIESLYGDENRRQFGHNRLCDIRRPYVWHLTYNRKNAMDYQLERDESYIGKAREIIQQLRFNWEQLPISYRSRVYKDFNKSGKGTAKNLEAHYKFMQILNTELFYKFTERVLDLISIWGKSGFNPNSDGCDYYFKFKIHLKSNPTNKEKESMQKRLDKYQKEIGNRQDLLVNIDEIYKYHEKFLKLLNSISYCRLVGVVFEVSVYREDKNNHCNSFTLSVVLNYERGKWFIRNIYKDHCYVYKDRVMWLNTHEYEIPVNQLQLTVQLRDEDMDDEKQLYYNIGRFVRVCKI